MLRICYRCGERYRGHEEEDQVDCPSCGEKECVFTHQQMADILNNLYVNGLIEEADLEYE